MAEYSTEELLRNIRKGYLYDYIAEHYYEMSKEQLKELILNIYYIAVEGKDDELEFCEILINELIDRGFDE